MVTSNGYPERVFISHKTKDRLAVEEIVNALRAATAGKITFFISEDFKKGRNWKEEISQCLHESDWFILLYTDRTLDWDWCLFEAGYFEAMMDNQEEDQKKLISIHHANENPPDPIVQYQAVKSVREDLHKFLHQMLDKANPHISKEDYEQIENKLIKAFQKTPDRHWCNSYIELMFSDEHLNEMKNKGKISDSVTVLSDKSGFELFGLLEKPGEKGRWGAFKEHLRNNNMNGWSYTLEKSIYLLCHGMNCSSALDIFYSPFHEKCYRPVLHAYDCRPDTRMMIRVTLVKIPDEDDPRPNNDMAPLINSLTTFRRVKWGLIERFHNDLSRLEEEGTDEKKVQECLLWLECTLKKFQNESSSQSVNLRSIQEVFIHDRERNEFHNNYEQWNSTIKKLMHEVHEGNAAEAKVLLAELRPLVKELMVLMCKRYQELIMEM